MANSKFYFIFDRLFVEKALLRILHAFRGDLLQEAVEKLTEELGDKIFDMQFQCHPENCYLVPFYKGWYVERGKGMEFHFVTGDKSFPWNYSNFDTGSYSIVRFKSMRHAIKVLLSDVSKMKELVESGSQWTGTCGEMENIADLFLVTKMKDEEYSDEDEEYDDSGEKDDNSDEEDEYSDEDECLKTLALYHNMKDVMARFISSFGYGRYSVVQRS